MPSCAQMYTNICMCVMCVVFMLLVHTSTCSVFVYRCVWVLDLFNAASAELHLESLATISPHSASFLKWQMKALPTTKCGHFHHEAGDLCTSRQLLTLHRVISRDGINFFDVVCLVCCIIIVVLYWWQNELHFNWFCKM